MESFISGLGGEEWVEGKISCRWNYRENWSLSRLGVRANIEKISFGLVRRGLGRKPVGKDCHGAYSSCLSDKSFDAGAVHFAASERLRWLSCLSPNQPGAARCQSRGEQ